jgi:hypothetical protein
LEQLRCGACGALFVAHMPPAAGEETYNLSLKVNLAVAPDLLISCLDPGDR